MSKPGERKGCGNCKHLQPGALFTTCAAFPRGIPPMFANAEAFHDRPFPGDRGIQYEPVPTAKVDDQQ
jgi:hypothetical protein